MNNNTQMIIIISSPSGAGKTSICKKLLKYDNSIKISISDTTRIPRDNEKDGIDYNFIDEYSFKQKIINKKYAEHAIVFGNYYGSLHANVSELLNRGFDVLFDIDWQGAYQLKNSKYQNILSFFIMPPSKDDIYERLKTRAKISGDDEDAINKRMLFYETEVSHKDEYDHIIINNEIDNCVKEIQSHILNRRNILKYD
jgi:guanylate kinase